MKKMVKVLCISVLLSNLIMSCGRYSHMSADSSHMYPSNFRQINTYRSRNQSRFNSFSSTKESSERKKQFIIKFQQSPTRTSLDKYADYYNFKIVKTTTLGVLVEKLSEESDQEFMAILKKHPKIEYVEKNNTYRINK